MGCSCGGGRKSAAQSPLYVLTLPTGKKKTYASEVDAKKAQTRLGGNIAVKQR